MQSTTPFKTKMQTHLKKHQKDFLNEDKNILELFLYMRSQPTQHFFIMKRSYVLVTKNGGSQVQFFYVKKIYFINI